VPVEVQATDTIKRAMEDTARALGGPIGKTRDLSNSSDGLLLRMGNDLETVAHFQNRISSLIFVLEVRHEKGNSTSCFLPPVGGLGNPYRLGINSVDSFIPDIIISFGPSMRFSYDFASSGIPKLDDHDGFVVVFKSPNYFTLELNNVPLQTAKQVTAITGKIVEGVRDKYARVSTYGSMERCTVAS
jgi:hypothetical protein